MRALDYLWLIPALPFLGAAVNGLLVRNRQKSLATAIGVGAPGLSLGLALACLIEFLARPGHAPFEQLLYPWTAGALKIDIAFLLDPLSAIMLFVVTFVGFLIHVYSVGYMAHEEGYRRYCSYLLIGFYFDQDFPPKAGRKAFIVNRIGDFAFLLGLFAIFSQFGTLSFKGVNAAVLADIGALEAPFALGLSLASFIALCLFVGAMGKSAQIPLYVWLPDAMAGPTPVSALIHAATMVTAGVYMVVRTNLIYQLAPSISLFVAIIGAATAIFAATIGIAQNDIKKVLAYSTVSQLGYMFLAAGVGDIGHRGVVAGDPRSAQCQVRSQRRLDLGLCGQQLGAVARLIAAVRIRLQPQAKADATGDDQKQSEQGCNQDPRPQAVHGRRPARGLLSSMRRSKVAVPGSETLTLCTPARGCQKCSSPGPGGSSTRR